MKEETTARIRNFSKERDWDPFHTPANLAKSISIEANELLECFQWSDTDYDLTHVGEELADVMVYCQNMLDALGLDEKQMPQVLRLPGPLPGLRDPVRQADGLPRAVCESGPEVTPEKKNQEE